MAVYFIRAGENGPVKIGFANDVWVRLRELQTGNHERLRLIGVAEGGSEVEAAYHDRFSAYRRIGEWFEPVEQILAEARPLPVPHKPHRDRQTNDTALSRYLDDNRLTYSAFGRRIDVSAQAVWRYANAERVPTPKVMRRIIEETDGAIGPGDFFGEAA